MQSVISVAFKTPLETRLEICTYKIFSLLHRPNYYIGFTPSCPPHILQQNCAHVHNRQWWRIGKPLSKWGHKRTW